jgi:AraC-like DNA-binding protein
VFNSAGMTVAKPLQNFVAVDTYVVEEACAEVARIFCPHRLSPHEKQASGFHAQHHSRPANDFSINFVAYGATVEIDPGMLSGFYLLQVPTNGSAIVKCGTQIAEVAAGKTASMLSPTLPTLMCWQNGCEKIIIQIKKQALHNMFESLCGRRADDIEFNTELDLRSPIGSIINNHVAVMVEAAEQQGPIHDRYLETLRDGLLIELLSSFQHSASKFLDLNSKSASASVKKADDYIMSNFDRQLAVTEIAQAVGISLRSLQSSYLKSHEITLWERLQQVRIEQFRTKLLNSQRFQTVTEIALDVGLGHVGRAAKFYFEKYGERPIDTLRRKHNPHN